MLVGLRSRKHIPPFELVRPVSLEQACLVHAGPGRSAVMAGGLDLIDRLKGGEGFDRIVHLGGVRELSGIRRDGDAISIGALTTHAEIARNALLSELLPDLSAIWSTIANPRVRYAGTLGGNLMSAMPHYDALPAFRALGAEAVTHDRVGAAAMSDLEALRGCNSILGRIRIGVSSSRRRLLADRSLHPIVSVFLGASIEGSAIRSARIAVGCAYTSAKAVDLQVAGVPIAALGADAADLARAVAASLPDPLADGLASGSYRRRMIEVLVRRLFIKLGSQP